MLSDGAWSVMAQSLCTKKCNDAGLMKVMRCSVINVPILMKVMMLSDGTEKNTRLVKVM